MANTSEAPATTRGALSIAKLERPLRILIYLLIALAIVELYRQTSTLVLQLTNIGLIFIFAAVVAMLVTPIVDHVQGIPLLRGHRGIAVLVLYGAILILVGLAAALLAPTVVADHPSSASRCPRSRTPPSARSMRRNQAFAPSASTFRTRFRAVELRWAGTSHPPA